MNESSAELKVEKNEWPEMGKLSEFFRIISQKYDVDENLLSGNLIHNLQELDPQLIVKTGTQRNKMNADIINSIYRDVNFKKGAKKNDDQIVLKINVKVNKSGNFISDELRILHLSFTKGTRNGKPAIFPKWFVVNPPKKI